MTDPILVLGSGMAALGAHEVLHAAGRPHVLVDKNAYPGGHTATFRDGSGFIFDDGPHISFTSDERLRGLLADNVGGAFERFQAYVDNYWHGHLIKHPAQVNLHGLPEELVIDCISDFVAAAGRDHGPIDNYEDWLLATFGPTFAQTFPMVYTRKYHTTDAANMSIDWLGPRIYQPDLREVLRGALSPDSADVHYVDKFRYPTDGGFMSYLEPWCARADLRLEHEVIGVDPSARTVSFRHGETLGYDQLVSSIPLPVLVPMITGAPPDVVVASQRLACTTAVIVNVGVGRDDISPAQWRYFYDEDVVFTRVSFPHLLSPGTCPPGCGSAQVEVYYSDKYRPLDCDPDELIQPVIRDLVRTGVLEEADEILFSEARLIKYANVIFDLERREALETVHGFLDDVGVRWCGRYGDWEYAWTDEAFFSGERAAQVLLAG